MKRHEKRFLAENNGEPDFQPQGKEYSREKEECKITEVFFY